MRSGGVLAKKSLGARAHIAVVAAFWALGLGLGCSRKTPSAPKIAVVTAVGTWATPDGKARFKIVACGPSLCGTLDWIRGLSPSRATSVRDKKNPNPALRARPLLGLKLMGGFMQNKNNPLSWEKGWIYDPQSGKTYACEITVISAQKLQLRGYVGVALLGATQTWTRF